MTRTGTHGSAVGAWTGRGVCRGRGSTTGATTTVSRPSAQQPSHGRRIASPHGAPYTGNRPGRVTTPSSRPRGRQRSGTSTSTTTVTRLSSRPRCRPSGVRTPSSPGRFPSLPGLAPSLTRDVENRNGKTKDPANVPWVTLVVEEPPFFPKVPPPAALPLQLLDPVFLCTVPVPLTVLVQATRTRQTPSVREVGERGPSRVRSPLCPRTP